jgi:hypothetical protein
MSASKNTHPSFRKAMGGGSSSKITRGGVAPIQARPFTFAHTSLRRDTLPRRASACSGGI